MIEWLEWGREAEFGVHHPLAPIVSERTMKPAHLDSTVLLSGFRSGRWEIENLLADAWR